MPAAKGAIEPINPIGARQGLAAAIGAKEACAVRSRARDRTRNLEQFPIRMHHIPAAK
jgi:hypothetical protein